MWVSTFGSGEVAMSRLTAPAFDIGRALRLFSCAARRGFFLRFLIRGDCVRQSGGERIRRPERGWIVGFRIDHVRWALEEIEDERFVPARETQIGKRLGFDGMEQTPCQ